MERNKPARSRARLGELAGYCLCRRNGVAAGQAGFTTLAAYESARSLLGRPALSPYARFYWLRTIAPSLTARPSDLTRRSA